MAVLSSVADRAMGLRSLSRYFPVIVAVAAGVVLSVVMFFLVREREQSLIDAEFERRNSIYVSALQKTIDQNLEVLQSIGSLYAASGSVERHHFRNFVKGSLLQYTEIQALEWVPRVAAAERASYEQLARDDGFADFRFTWSNAQSEMGPAGQRPEYFPVYYVEPLRGNEAALGFDLASDATLRAGLDKARDSLSMAASVG